MPGDLKPFSYRVLVILVGSLIKNNRADVV